MPRHEAHREDLMRDAVALVDRIELRQDSSREPVVIGFRKDCSVSVYFGEEPVYQFNADGELRRAHLGGIIKAESGKLVRLMRRRTAGQVQLIRHELSATEQGAFLSECRQRLMDLRSGIAAESYRVSRVAVADERDVLRRVKTWLGDLPNPLRVAAALSRA